VSVKTSKLCLISTKPELKINRMDRVNVKEEAKKLIEKLPDDVSWDDLMHQIYVRQSIEQGLADHTAGKVTDVTELRSKFGLSR